MIATRSYILELDESGMVSAVEDAISHLAQRVVQLAGSLEHQMKRRVENVEMAERLIKKLEERA